MTREEVVDQYRSNFEFYLKFQKEIDRQLKQSIRHGNFELHFPIESRIKEESSVVKKILADGKIKSIHSLNDIVGFRIVTPFEHELKIIEELIAYTFKIQKRDNKIKTLSESEFGYTSIHFDIGLKPTPPTKDIFHGRIAELQIRTSGQHIWAVASHSLAYKPAGQKLPALLNRSLGRLSALLELVDKEFARIRVERFLFDDWNEKEIDQLSVRGLRYLGTHLLDFGNEDDESLEEVIIDLHHFKINDIRDVMRLLDKHKDGIIQAENDIITISNMAPVQEFRSFQEFSFAGKIRQAIKLEFGDVAESYIKSRNDQKWKNFIERSYINAVKKQDPDKVTSAKIKLENLNARIQNFNPNSPISIYIDILDEIVEAADNITTAVAIGDQIKNELLVLKPLSEVEGEARKQLITKSQERMVEKMQKLLNLLT